MKSYGYAALEKKSPLAPWSFERRDPRPNDVVIDIAYCGVCHSDIHQVSGDWGSDIFPMVPGHEIVGHVAKVGSAVKKFKEGDRAAVGVMVDSDRVCDNCRAGLEQYCAKGMVATYNARGYDGCVTYGGYSNNIVVDERYAFTLSPRLDMAAAAPLLCAGITTYSPLKHWNAGPGKKVGIIGLGGLGHMGLKFAHALGAHVVQFTTSPNKRDDALKLGADEVVVSTDRDAMAKHAASFDFLLDCVAAKHDVDAYLSLLRLDGTLCSVGIPDQPISVFPFSLIKGRRSLAGSSIGGVPETQQMLDFCADHGIVSEIELTAIDKLAEVYERVIKGDVKYRFVIDMATLKK
ncbi:MAG: NAD(P)-dependent alcohol dehydrogenase [Acidobacteriaceae bacterium]|nr:NAD(P)-dependent alcohol dehydrogenase [Acidobacteriaceae bacterium]